MLESQWRIQGFLVIGVPTLQGAPRYDFAKFSQNCMKLKEFGLQGGEYVQRTPLKSTNESPTIYSVLTAILKNNKTKLATIAWILQNIKDSLNKV